MNPGDVNTQVGFVVTGGNTESRAGISSAAVLLFLLMAAVIAVGIFLVCCKNSRPRPPIDPDSVLFGDSICQEKVASLSVVPVEIAVPVSTPDEDSQTRSGANTSVLPQLMTFELTAYARDKANLVVPQHCPLQLDWRSSDSALAQVEAGAVNRGIVRIGSKALALPSTATITVALTSSSSIAASAVVHVYSHAGNDQDLVQAWPSRSLAIALVDGRKSADGLCVNDTPFPFVQYALLPNIVGHCPEGWAGVTVFETESAAIFEGTGAAHWSVSSPDTVDVSDAHDQIVGLKVAFWIVVDSLTLEEYAESGSGYLSGLDVDSARALALLDARKDFVWANSVFRNEKAGFRVDTVSMLTVTEPGEIAAIAGAGQKPFYSRDGGCEATAHHESDKFATLGSYEPGALNVYYVGRERGPSIYWPRTNGRESDVIVVRWANRSYMTLGHEIGHALSLFHLSDVQDNVMYTFPNNYRSRFTVGQLFAMNFDRCSWVNVNDRSGQTVDCLFADSECPPVELGASW